MTRQAPVFTSEFRNGLAELIHWRRDVRRFAGTPVDPALIIECLELANLAPSVGLSQPWRFVEVASPSCRANIIASFERCNADALKTYSGETATNYARLKLEGLREAPVQLAVFADSTTNQGKRLGRNSMPEMLNYSVVTAIHTFWLAARAHDLGVGWVSILDPKDVCATCKTPPNWTLIAYLCVGWPAAQSLEPELQHQDWEQRGPMNGHFSRV